MGALTEELPKPMLPLRGKPMLEHILDRLGEAGLRQALVVTGFRAEVIEAHFALYPMPVSFRRQAKLDGTGSAARLARKFCGDDPFLLTFGDILTEASDYRAMLDLLEQDAAAEAVLAAKWVEDPWQGAAIYESARVVNRIVEKPPPGSSSTHWNSAGVYVFRPSIFKLLEALPLSPRGEYELTTAVELLLAQNSRVLMHGLRGSWRDVGRPDDLGAAQNLV
jgi:UDP-N-acetylglucosamine diphosphorylase / glucose-1-phosphate thymidylyltransferase / UDP-N-acetylgalactosamine diphosphorylase / glucosamine-1-phosphate N-acetyltransferase / galactosamine-1-phosphate N-acetyltransferase